MRQCCLWSVRTELRVCGEKSVVMAQVNNRQLQRIKSGFSLIELLLAASIAIMLVSVGMTRFIQYNQRQRARTAISRVAQLMREAKANAASGKKDCEVCGGGDARCDGVNDSVLLEWRLTFSGALVSLYGICDPNLPFMVRDEVLPVVVTPAGPCSNAHYRPDGTVSIPTTCTVTATGGGGTYWVQLTQTGAVNSSPGL